MKILGIESSSSIFSAAVSEGGKIQSSVQVQGQGRPSALLTDLIDQALVQARLTLKDLDALAVSIGPGSFTGLRVGVLTVKTLSWALKKPVLPVSSLEAIAHNEKKSPLPIMVLLDARKGNVYCAIFEPSPANGVKRLAPDQRMRPEEAVRLLTRPMLVVGDALKRYESLFSGLPITKAPESSAIARAEAICTIAQGASQPRVDDPHRLVPQYLYSQESDITGQ